jgi:hypothetical protein
MIKEITRNIFIGATLAGKTTNEVFEQWEIDAPTRPRFGRNWWYWKPTFRTNGGGFKPYLNTDINFHWLCIAAWVTIFCWKPKRNSNKII